MTTDETITGKRVEVRDISFLDKESWETVDLCEHVSIERVATRGNEYFTACPEYKHRLLIRCKACNTVHEITIMIN